MKDKLSRKKRFVFAGILIVSSFLIAVVMAELIFDYIYFYGRDIERPWIRRDREDKTNNIKTVNPNFGFADIFASGDYSSKYGTLNEFTHDSEKHPEITRVLFVGDSVTKNSRIVHALINLYGKKKFEYWNAGVDSFTTVQEVELYRRYNRSIAPDHVVLTFHNNDFQSTAVAFFDSKKQLCIYTPQKFIENVSPWFFEHSGIYRLILGLRLKEERDRSVIENEVRMSLLELKILTEQDEAKLSVLIFPILKPYQRWSPEEKENQKSALKILKELNIRHFDLFPISEQAIMAGMEVQDKEGDIWHPNDAVSAKFADFLRENNFL